MKPVSADQRAIGDIWHDWLLKRRHAQDGLHRQFLQQRMEAVRDRVLDGAKLHEGMTLVDVGAGEGLIAFGAIDRIGPSLSVILTDISASLLKHAEKLAKEEGVHAQCVFLQGSAEKLNGLADASVDVVAARALLAYVSDKRAALAEFFRVLKPGGRISLAEPICQDDALANLALGKMLEAQPHHPQRQFLTLLQRYRAAQYPSTEHEIFTNPMTSHSERDLFQLVRETGFAESHLELHIDHRRAAAITWDASLDISPHPWAPTLREILAEHFTVEERMLLERGLKPMIESGNPVTHESIAYLTAEKPG